MARSSRTRHSSNFKDTFKRAVEYSENVSTIVDAIKNVTSLFAGIGSTFVAMFCTGVSTGAIRVPALQIGNASFPIRLTLFILVAAGLGWALGSLVEFAGRLRHEFRPLVANLLALIFAGLLAGTADWLMQGNAGRQIVPQAAIMTLVGAGITLRGTAYQFEIMAKTRANTDILARTGIMLVFTVATVAIILLNELGLN